MLQAKILCGGSVVTICASESATTPLAASKRPVSAKAAQPAIVVFTRESSAAWCIARQRHQRDGHPAADCSSSGCPRAAFQSPSSLSWPTAGLLSCYRAAFTTAPLRRCAQLHCRRRQPPAASALRTHRAACRTPNPHKTHHAPPKRTAIAGNAASSATPAAIVRRCRRRSRRLFTRHSASITRTQHLSGSTPAAHTGCQTASSDITACAATMAATSRVNLTQSEDQCIGSCLRHAGIHC